MFKKETFLIIKPGAIGDVLHMTPVIRALKKSSPDSGIIFLTGSRATSMLLYNNPYLDETIFFEKGRGMGEIQRVCRLGTSLRKRGIDRVLNYQPSGWRWRLLTYILRPKGVIFYKKQKKINAGDRKLHAVEDHLLPLTKIGVKSFGLYLDFFLTDRESEDARKLLLSPGNDKRYKGIVAFNMGASHPVNRWPVSCFYDLGRFLEGLGYRIILCGGPEDRVLVEQFRDFGPSSALDLVGTLSIRQTAAVLNLCDVLVSADTGPLHLATAVGTRVVGLYGPADPIRTGPVGDSNHIFQAKQPCVPCCKRRCALKKRICMESISFSEVGEKVVEMVRG